jgi:hypothetical protein
MPTTAGMLAKVVKLATACREANNNMDQLTSKITTAAAVEKPVTYSRYAINSSNKSQLL